MNGELEGSEAWAALCSFCVSLFFSWACSLTFLLFHSYLLYNSLFSAYSSLTIGESQFFQFRTPSNVLGPLSFSPVAKASAQG